MRPIVSLLLITLLTTCNAAATGTSALPGTAISFELQHEYRPQLRDDLDDLSQLAFDISDLESAPSSSVVTLQAKPTTVYRPRSPAGFQHARLRSLRSEESEPVEWDEVHVLGPDIEDRHTLSQLARMTGNAYALPGRKNWYDIDAAWNTVRDLPLRPSAS